MPQPQASHSQLSQVQNSPWQSGHAQPTQAQPSDALAVFPAQHERTACFGADVAARQAQFLHSHFSHVQNSPLQSGQAHSTQPQQVDLAAFCSVAVNAQAATPTVSASAAPIIDAIFMIISLWLRSSGRVQVPSDLHLVLKHKSRNSMRLTRESIQPSTEQHHHRSCGWVKNVSEQASLACTKDWPGAVAAVMVKP